MCVGLAGPAWGGATRSELFFENPAYVYLTLALAEFALLAIWYERRGRNWALSLAAPVVAAAVVALVAHLVKTDREQIVAAAEDIAAAVQARQPARIPPHLDEQFTMSLHGFTLLKADVVEVCNAETTQWGINTVKFHKVEVAVDGKRARMRIITLIYYQQGGNQPISLIWNVDWIKRSDGWKILKVDEPRQGFEL